MDQSRLDALISSYDRADAIRQSLISEKSIAIVRLSEIEEYLEHKDEVTETLLAIQREIQSCTTEAYESLLTELLHMVMPDDPANHRVVMSHYIKNNAVSLKTEIETRDGYRHDIYEDKGQSVENIMALCLRFLALGRTSNRRFLLFDESDHGIMPAYMDRFSEVLYQLTYRIGMQVIYISHHDWRLFEGKARIIELSRDGDSIVSNVVSEPPKGAGSEFNSEIMEYMSGIGITDITLKNYKAHLDTSIELSPFLNVIIGPMDLGKSTIISALDSMKRNKGGESKIRDGERELSVEVGMEEGRRLLWTYGIDAPKKSKYVLYEPDGSVIKLHQGAKEIPEFLDDYLVMPLHCGYDLHIADSHDSSFVFAKHVTEAKAAEILSFDDETTQAQDLLVQHKDNISLFKKEQKQLHLQINKIKSKLSLLSHLDNGDINTLREARVRIRNKGNDDAASISIMAGEIEAKEKKVLAMKKLSGVLKIPEKPGLACLGADSIAKRILLLMTVIESTSRASSCSSYPKKPMGVDSAERLLQRISPLEERIAILGGVKPFTLPEKPVVDDGPRRKSGSIYEGEDNRAKILKEAKEMESSIKDINQSIQHAIYHNGGVCPLCQSKM